MAFQDGLAGMAVLFAAVFAAFFGLLVLIC